MGVVGILVQGPGGSPSSIDEDGAERRLVVCSAYLPYDSEDPPPSWELEDLVRYCKNENIQLLVGCDSNAQHTAWGSTSCKGRGEGLIEFLNTSNLEIFNRGSEPTFCTSVRQEKIDITLGSHGLLDIITNCVPGWQFCGNSASSARGTS